MLICVISAYEDLELKVRERLHCDPVKALLDWVEIGDIVGRLNDEFYCEVSKRCCFCLLDPELVKTDRQAYLGRNI